MASVNEVRLIGQLGADVELRSANGTDVCTVTIATDSYKGKGENRSKVTDCGLAP